MCLHTSLYTIYIKLQDSEKYLLVHGYTGALDIVQTHVANFLRQGGRIDDLGFENNTELNQATIDVLIKRGYLTNRSPIQERDYVCTLAEQMHKLSSRKSSFLFLITYDCNFRCPYCYENNISNFGKGWSKSVFTKDLVDRAYQTMLEIQPNRKMHDNNIIFYGGEPLLAQNYKIVSHIVKEGVKRNYKFIGITNGYDLDKYTDLLLPEMIQTLQVTIDGVRDVHNSRRNHYKEGKTFDRIMDNIDRVLQSGVTVILRINTDRSNISTLPELSQIFIDRGWSKLKNFSAYSALSRGDNDSIDCNSVMAHKAIQIQNSGIENKCELSRTFPQNDLSNYIKKMIISESKMEWNESHLLHPDSQYIDFEKEEELFHQGIFNNKTENLPKGFYESLTRIEFTKEYYDAIRRNEQLQVISCQDFSIKWKIKKSLNRKGFIPFHADFCGAETGSIIFDSYGDIYTCWEMVGIENYKVGKYEDKLVFDEKELDSWRGRNINTVSACRKCKYSLFCGGGCEAHALMEGRGPRAPYCDSFPVIFRSVVPEAYKEILKERENLFSVVNENTLN